MVAEVDQEQVGLARTVRELATVASIPSAGPTRVSLLLLIAGTGKFTGATAETARTASHGPDAAVKLPVAKLTTAGP